MAHGISHTVILQITLQPSTAFDTSTLDWNPMSLSRIRMDTMPPSATITTRKNCILGILPMQSSTMSILDRTFLLCMAKCFYRRRTFHPLLLLLEYGIFCERYNGQR